MGSITSDISSWIDKAIEAVGGKPAPTTPSTPPYVPPKTPAPAPASSSAGTSTMGIPTSYLVAGAVGLGVLLIAAVALKR